MNYSPRDTSESWHRAESVFRNLPLGVQKWLHEQAHDTILGMLEKESEKYKGKMGTPPIYFPQELGIPETFVIVKNPKTKETFGKLDPHLVILVIRRGRWDKPSRSQIERWANTAAIALAGHQYGAGAERVISARVSSDPLTKYGPFETEAKPFDLSRMGRALENWLRQINPNWLREQEAKYPGARVVTMPQGTPASLGFARDLHLPKAKPIAVGLVLLKRYLQGDPQYDAFRGALHIPALTIVGEQLPDLFKILGAKERVIRLTQYNQEQYDAVLWELAVAAGYLALDHQVEFIEESPTEKRPDLLLIGRTPKTYIECKRGSIYSKYELKERSEWHRIHDPITKYLQKHPLEVDIQVDFLIALEEVRTVEVFNAFRTLISGTLPQEFTNDRFRLSIRPLPPLKELPYPVSLVSPEASRLLFGFVDDGSFDGASPLFAPRIISEDGLWVSSVYWRACLRWKSCSFNALSKKARGVLIKLVGASKQIPKGSHGILHLAVQEWLQNDVRDIRWAKIVREIRNFYHDATVRIPYIFLNRLICRVNDTGGPDFEENCVILQDEKIGDPAEANRLPQLILAG